MSIFAQNNGVIALTRCANRRAGFCCAGFLILFGVIGKISGVFLSIPNPVLGGVTTFLFASVVAAGVKILSYMKWTRKDRFILAAAGSIGFGNLMQPTWATFLFADVQTTNAGLQGLFNSIVIVLSTPYLIGGLIATILNLIIPDDPPEADEEPIELTRGLGDSTLETSGGLGLPTLAPRAEKSSSSKSDDDEDYKARVEPAESSGARV